MGGNKYYCRINGIIYNLKMIQDIIDKNPEHLRQNIYMVLTEEYQISDHIADLLSEIVEGTKKIPTDYNEALKEYQARDCKRSGIPEGGQEDSCSKSGNIQCRSANTSKHTGDNKYYCRIDGALYDLKKIQDIIDANPKYLGGEISMALWEEYHIPDLTAFLLGDIIEETKEIPADYNEALKEYQARNRKKYGIPERFRHSDDSNDKNSRNRGCPRCGSTYISKPIWSLYDYKCKTCGHEWVRCPRCGGSNIKITKTPPLCAGKNSFNKCKTCGHDWFRC